MDYKMTTLNLGVRSRLDAAGDGIDRAATLELWSKKAERHLTWLFKFAVLVMLKDDESGPLIDSADSLQDVTVKDRLSSAVLSELDRWDGWSVTVSDNRPKQKPKTAVVTDTVNDAAAKTPAE